MVSEWTSDEDLATVSRSFIQTTALPDHQIYAPVSVP
jgi:hypothetical protein